MNELEKKDSSLNKAAGILEAILTLSLSEEILNLENGIGQDFYQQLSQTDLIKKFKLAGLVD